MVKEKTGSKEQQGGYNREKQMELQRQLKMLKDLDSSCSSESMSNSTDSYLPMEEIYEEEEDQADMLYTLYATDSESVQEEEPEYIKVKPLEKEVDFFEVITAIPQVENVSEDISMASIKITKPAPVAVEARGDTGKFVDPLTGLELASSQESRSTDDAPAPEAVEALAEDAIDVLQTRDSDSSDFFLPDYVFADDEDLKRIADVEDTLETFLEMEAKKFVPAVEDVDWEAIAKEQEAKRVLLNTLDFITDLINKVVEDVEYISPETVLRQNLDKRKLVKELLSKLPLYSVEQSVQQFLNRKIVQYYRRKKSFRPIMPDNLRTVTQDKIKFKEAVQRLDHLLEKESKLKSSTTEIIENLQKEYSEAKEVAETKVQLFASMVKKSLIRESNPKTNALIELLLSRMNNYRKEVNEVRFVMFTYQHNQARLTEELSKLENLGNGLSMGDFSSLQAETNALGKKIEERNVELNKLHIRCRSDLHSMAHYKEKQKMLRNVISIQRSSLEVMQDDKHELREYLHSLKLQHKSVRQQINGLSFQGGLLDKPSLMFDYDDTVKLLHERHAIVDDLRKTLRTTQQKIDDIVKQCPELQVK